jgi:hypothetical protein
MIHELCHSSHAVPILAAQRGEVQQVVGRQHGFQAAAVDAVGVVDLTFFLAGLGRLACVRAVSYLVVQEGVEKWKKGVVIWERTGDSSYREGRSSAQAALPSSHDSAPSSPGSPY